MPQLLTQWEAKAYLLSIELEIAWSRPRLPCWLSNTGHSPDA